MPIHRFARESLPASPWKNGGGVTWEIACQPLGAGMDDFDWRVSIAHIASSGPFSAFAGVDRVITLLEGAGVRLHSGDGSFDHRLDMPLAPFAFAGEAPVEGTLLDGECHDLNVMTRRATCRAGVWVCRTNTTTAAPAGLFMAVRGTWTAGTHTLAPGQGLWWCDELITWSLACPRPSGDDDAALVAVAIHPVNT